MIAERTPWGFITHDAREVCDLTLPEGRAEYQRRKRVAWEEQRGLCGICFLRITLAESTVDHIEPRGMGGGRRDDSQRNIRAAHMFCNSEKGSRR